MWEQRFKFTSETFANKTPEVEQAVLAADDPLHDMMRLAGLPPANNVLEAHDPNQKIDATGVMSPLGSNISVTGMEKRRLEKENNIKPGSPEWFRLWFSRPYLTGEKPVA